MGYIGLSLLLIWASTVLIGADTPSDGMCPIDSAGPDCLETQPKSSRAALEAILSEAKKKGIPGQILRFPAHDLSTSLSQSRKALERELPTSKACPYQSVAQTESAVACLGDSTKEKTLLENVRKLATDGTIRGAVARTCKGKNPNCRKSAFRFFSQDGWMLCLDFPSEG